MNGRQGITDSASVTTDWNMMQGGTRYGCSSTFQTAVCWHSDSQSFPRRQQDTGRWIPVNIFRDQQKWICSRIFVSRTDELTGLIDVGLTLWSNSPASVAA